eukprot:TRINITY_DN64821_c0_g1_i1.p2 TRINITY_DN64821_c0_g1~~TRINITY_DN64821_c0_g1_i1.p2  ORF type:complete len:345 (+),score=129.87 TRINITY_DN64821_c0_g1_i1:64-1035(+)
MDEASDGSEAPPSPPPRQGRRQSPPAEQWAVAEEGGSGPPALPLPPPGARDEPATLPALQEARRRRRVAAQRREMLGKLRRNEARSGQNDRLWVMMRCPVAVDEEAEEWAWDKAELERRQRRREADRSAHLARLAAERAARWAHPDSDSDPEDTAARVLPPSPSTPDGDARSTVRRVEHAARLMRRRREAKAARRDAPREEEERAALQQHLRYVAECEALNLQVLTDACRRTAALRAQWFAQLRRDREEAEAARGRPSVEQLRRVAAEAEQRRRADAMMRADDERRELEWQERWRRERALDRGEVPGEPPVALAPRPPPRRLA